MSYVDIIKKEMQKKATPITNFKGGSLPLSDAPSNVRAIPLQKPKSYIPWSESKTLKQQESELARANSDLARYTRYFERAEELSTRSPALRQAQMNALNKEYGITDEASYNNFVDQYKKLYEDTESLIGKYNVNVDNEKIRYKLWQESLRPYEDVQKDIDSVDAEISRLEKEKRKNDTENVTTEGYFTSPQLRNVVPTAEGKKRSAELQTEIESAEKRRAELLNEKADSQNYYYSTLPGKADFAEKSVENDNILDDVGNIWGTVVKATTSANSPVMKTIYATADKISESKASNLVRNYGTKEQKAIYQYLYNTQEKKAADDYAEYIKEDTTAKKASEIVKNTEKLIPVIEQLSKVKQSFDSGVEQFYQGAYSAVTGKETNPTAQQLAAGEYINKTNLAGKVVYGLSQTIGNMTPSILLSTMTGVPALGTVSMGISAGGNAFSEAIKKGASKEEAYAYGTLIGLSEALLQKALGGIGKLGGGKIGTKLASKINAIDKAWLAISAKYVGDMASEGIEEGLQTILEPMFQTMVLDEKYQPAKLADVVYSAALGFLTAGIFEGAGPKTEYMNSPIDNKVIDEFIKKGEKAKENSLERAIADELKEKLAIDPNAVITGFDVGRIARFYKNTRKAEKTEARERKKTMVEMEAEAEKAQTATPENAAEQTEFEEAVSAPDVKTVSSESEPEDTTTVTAAVERAEQPEVKNTTPAVSRDGIEIKPETDPEIQSRIANAKDELERTGILSGASDKTISTVRRLSKLLKTDIRFEVVSQIAGEDGETYDQNGRYDHNDGIIYINMGSGTDTYTQIIAHEFTHSVEGTKLYTLLEKYARKFHNGKAGEGAFNAKAKEILEQYRAANKNYDIRKAQAEVVSNYVANELLNNEANIGRLVKENRPLAEKLKDIVDIVLSAIGTKVTKKEAQTKVKLTRMSKLLNKALETRNAFPKFKKDIETRLSELRRDFDEGDISESEYDRRLDELDNEALSMGLDLQELMKDGESYSLIGVHKDGKKIYKSNFPKGTPKAAKSNKILSLIQNVWSKEPIRLIISNGETSRTIFAKFDPTVDKTKNTPTDASKIAGGNRHGNHTEQRVTLDLADDYYQIAVDSTYNYSKIETGKSLETHEAVNMWHYFVEDIYFVEDDSDELVPYTVTINVKEKDGGDYVYSYNAEKESPTRRTLHADVNTYKGANGELFLDNSIPQSNEKVNSKKDTDSYSITPEKTAEESIDKSTSDVSIVTRLPIQSLGKLRAVEKGLRKAIGDIYKIKYARVDELKPAIRNLTEKYLSNGKITADDIAEFTDFIKTTFEIESTNEDTNRVRYQLNEAITEDLKHIRDFFKQLEKDANAQPEWVQESREERAKRFSNKKIREFRNWVREEFSVPESERETLDALIANVVARIENGTVPKYVIDSFFGAVFNSAEVTEDSLKRDFPDVYKTLRHDKLTLTDSEKSDLAGYDNYKEFREDAQGYLNLGKDGTSVEDMYAFCHNFAPSLFPDSIDNTNDQAVRLLEVSKMFTPQKRWAFEEMSQEEREKLYDEFTKQVLGVARDVTTSQRYAQGTSTVEQEAEVDGNDVDVEELLDVMEKMKKERRKMLSVRGRTILSRKDEGALRAILDGHITVDQLSDEYNKKDIKAIYEASKEYTRLKNIVDEQRRQIHERRYDMARKYLAEGDILTGFRDRNHGLLYMLNPMERNLRYIGKRSQLSEDLIDAYIKPIKKANKNAILYKNSIVQKIEDLGLSRKVKAGDEYSEAYAVQFVGEAENNIKYLKKLKDDRATKDGHTLEEWQTMLDNFWKVNPGIDRNKINGAVDVFREVYNDLFKKMNEARVRNGYEPISYRSGYFPHFSPKESNDILAQFGKALGITVEFSGLPTDINGLTQNFRPGMRYQAFANERLGFETVFDAVEGLHRYLDTAADVIYQTDNICNLRALSQQIRYQASDEGKRKREDFIRLRTDLDETERAAVLDKIHEGGKYTLSNFVNDLEEYTNLLAGKKSKWDRGAEALLGRSLYGLMKNVSGRIAANLVAWNVPSWLTNFIPLVQGATGLDTKYMLFGMKEAMRNLYEADGFESQSVWLTTRRGSEELLKRYELTNIPTSKLGKALDKEALHKIGRALDKSAEIGMIPMEAIDMFVSNILVRGRYHQNVDKGMTEEAALEEADSWVASIMADRSKGGLPTIFGATNPMVKLLTQFQVEVANQIGFFFSDLPIQLRDKEAKAIVLSIAKYVIGAYLYNELYELLTGRRPALDPLGIINDSIGDFSGKKFRDPVDAIVSLAKGENFLAEAYKMPVGEAMWEFTAELAEETPFVGGLLGGGRIPISSALPSVSNMVKSVGKDGALRKIGKELLKPVTYSILPGGGGQISKTAKGISAVAQGGKYGKDNKGREILQYPITPNPWTVFQSAVFGPTATKGGREWINSNFKSSLSYVETKAYKEAVYEGMTQDEAYDLIEFVSSAGNKNSQKIAALNNAKVPQNVKRAVYEEMFLPDSPTRQATLNALDNVGNYRDVVIDFMIEHPEASTQEEIMAIWGDVPRKGTVIQKSRQLNTKEKAAIIQVLTDTSNNPYWEALKNSVYYVVHPEKKLEDQKKKK